MESVVGSQRISPKKESIKMGIPRNYPARTDAGIVSSLGFPLWIPSKRRHKLCLVLAFKGSPPFRAASARFQKLKPSNPPTGADVSPSTVKDPNPNKKPRKGGAADRFRAPAGALHWWLLPQRWSPCRACDGGIGTWDLGQRLETWVALPCSLSF